MKPNIFQSTLAWVEAGRVGNPPVGTTPDMIINAIQFLAAVRIADIWMVDLKKERNAKIS